MNSIDALLATINHSPDAYPQHLDLAGKRMLIVGLSPWIYRSASFLDDRILAPGIARSWVDIKRIEEATRPVAAPRATHLILHTGHVGSTLLSRLLDDLGGTLGLREPLPLRTLAEAADTLKHDDALVSPEEFGSLADLCVRLWSRGYSDTQQCIVKSTSSACRVAPRLLERRAGMRAAYLNVRAERYLATLLAGENSIADLRGHGQERYRRLRAGMVGPLAPLHTLSTGELAALGWMAESLVRHKVAADFPAQILLLDFDALLAELPATLSLVARHFGIECETRQLEATAVSATVHQYSKAPEYNYGPALRRDILADSRQRNAAEIRAGMRWIEALARAHPQLQTAVATSGL